MSPITEATIQNDLREFITAVEKRGELAHVPNAHWDRELGAVTEVLYRQKVEKSPMLLFDDIPDYPRGYRCAYGMFGSPYRLSLVLGMEPSMSDNRKEMLDHFRKHIKKGFKRIPPKMVKDGPVLENIMRDGDVDMLKFPVPIHHEDDGGRYIGTACGVVTRDPDTGRINVGTYRVQVKGPRHLRFVHIERQAGPHPSRQISEGRQALPGGHHRRLRPDHVSRGRLHDARHDAGIRMGRRPDGPADGADRRRGDRAAFSRALRRSCWKARSFGDRDHARRPVRRMARLLRGRGEGRAGDPHQAHLPPQQSDPDLRGEPEAAAFASVRALLPALGGAARCARRRGHTGREGRVAASGRRGTHLLRGVGQAALFRALDPGRAGRVARSRRWATSAAGSWWWTTTSIRPTSRT